MRTRTWVIIASLALISPVGALYGWVQVVQHQRIQDAEPAFRPIEHLRPMIFSQPVAFYRSCRYVVEFSPDCELSDSNVTELRALNQLPPMNTLDVTIHTRRLTDRALPTLKAIRTFDLLDVTDTSISDEGIEELRLAFPKCAIPKRERTQ